jgi:hypothetical protein
MSKLESTAKPKLELLIGCGIGLTNVSTPSFNENDLSATEFVSVFT